MRGKQESASVYQQDPGKSPKDCILRVLSRGHWNVRLDKQEIIDLGALSWDAVFNNLARTPEDGANLLLGWLLEA